MESLREEDEAEHSSRGSVREVANIAWPIVVGMLSYTAMGVADTLVVGWLGVTELAAVGLATTAVFLINSLFLGTLHGVKVLASQATGAAEHSRAARVGWQGVLVAVPFGLLVIGLSAMDAWIFSLMGGPADVQEAARQYFVVRVLASPFWYVTVALSDYFQGTGDTRTPMKVNLLVNGLNIVLDVLLVFGWGPVPSLGIAGAAWATVLASVAGMLVIFPLFVRRVDVRPEVEPALMREMLAVGLPIGVKYTLHVGGFTVFTAVVARAGEVELAANQVALKVISMSFLPGAGIGEAATVLTGQYLGARRFDGLRRSFYSALGLAVSLMAVFGVVFWVAPHGLVGLFTDDPAVIAVGSELLLLAAVFQVFDAVEMTASGALNGTGDTRFTMWVSIVGAWVVLVPLSWFLGLVLDLGAFGAWIALTVQIVLASAVVTWRFRTEPWSR
jgi:MATE family multidrug resistance protein